MPRGNFDTGAALSLERLSSLLTEAIKENAVISSGDLKKLQTNVDNLRDVVEDAEKQQLLPSLQHIVQNVTKCLGRLKNAVYEAEDMLDELITDAHHKMAKMRNLSSPCLHSYKLANKIRDINKTLEDIERELEEYGLQANSSSTATQETNSLENCWEFSETRHFADDVIFGREYVRQRLVELLIDSDNQGSVAVLPIIGVGGIGKTTLAQLIYEDGRVKEYFELRIWVLVSEKFDLQRILTQISESIKGDSSSKVEVDTLTSFIRENLNRKRFLLVLDNVWNEDPEKWDRLKSSFATNVKGSKVIVTTRRQSVAMLMGTIDHPYHLELLSEVDSWALFKSRALPINTEANSELVDIGMKIVRKCNGLPLSIKLLGSLMYYKRGISEWQAILNHPIWKSLDYDFVLPFLLSYSLLPLPLKRCFAYCSLFPEDFTFEKKKLVQMWMAEGFIQMSQGSKELELIGEDYFKILVSCSFFKHEGEKEFDGVHACKMHNLVRDLALMVSRECLELSYWDTTDFYNVRRISTVSCLDIPNALWKVKNLRTFINVSLEGFDCRITKFKCLRVLYMGSSYIHELPSSIGDLKLLRYLDLSGNYMTLLPDSITSLWNLQTLRLENCLHLEILPKGIEKMVNLKFLEIDGCQNLTQMPTEIRQRKLVQSSLIFKVGHSRKKRIGQLLRLNINGELMIENLENVHDGTDAMNANLKGKQNIRTLKLCWNEETSDEAVQNGILEGLQPHDNLENLEINNFKGNVFPAWMTLSFLPKLVKILLYRCNKCKTLPPLGRLPNLRVLLVSFMDSVCCIGGDFYGVTSNQSEGNGVTNSNTTIFPSLVELTLWNMHNLSEWVEATAPASVSSCFPCLQKLDIIGAPKLKRTPTLFPFLKDLALCRSTCEALASITGNLSSLTSLQIYSITDMESLPQGLLQRNNLLKIVHIHRCTKLQALPVAEELRLLSTLEELKIGGFAKELECFPAVEGIQQLSSLRKLEIIGWPKLKTLPDKVQELTHLQQLTIRSCGGLEELPKWIVKLKSLEELMIFDCNNMMSLPEGIQDCLTKLKRLEIEDCQHLLQSCAKGRGKDWKKIDRIPCLIFD